jgi:hypothetical protein
VLGRFLTVRDYLRDVSGPLPEDIFVLLSMSRRERTVLGMELDGETLKRDVLQTAVSFCDYRYLAPSDSERMTRRELKKRGFDFLLERALERIVAEKTRRGELARERQLLRRKLAALKSGRWGLDPLFSDTDEPGPGTDALEAEICAIDAKLGQFSGMELGLEESLHHVTDTLSRPEKWLSLHPLRLSLDYRGIKLDESDVECPEPIDVFEIASSNGLRRIVLLGRIPRDQLPEPADMIKLGQAYLG